MFVKQFSEGDTLRTYEFNAQYHSLDRGIERHWPQLYACVDGRLVFIHLPVLGELNNYCYTEKSKRRLKRKLEPFLPEKTAVWWPGPGGKKRRVPDLRMNEKFQMHGGRTIYVFSSKPPQVVHNRY